MCLILVAYRNHPRYRLLIAANRDEYHERPTQYAHFWPDNPDILAGRDGQQMGTWLGINKNGRFAAVTNIRSPAKYKISALSRGELVSHFLSSNIDTIAYLQDIADRSDEYNEFNLLVGDADGLYFLSSNSDKYIELNTELFGISNGDFDERWPKVETGTQMLANQLNSDSEIDHDSVINILADTATPEENLLPDTGIDLAMEKKLAPIFVSAGEYGTRASTVLTINSNGQVKFTERNFDKNAEIINTLEYQFYLTTGQ